MKKRAMAIAGCTVLAAALFAGCGKSDLERSGQYKLNLDKLVTEVGDYSAVPVELTTSYETTQEEQDSYFNSMVSSIKSYQEITDRTKIQEGDYVLVDYTGYRDNEAFEGGSTTGSGPQYVLVGDGNGYIDGFTTGLVDKSVGETTKYDVTFPDEYPNNPDLAGVTVQFEFTIHGIYTSAPITAETVTDEDIKTNFESSYGVATIQELKDYIQNYLTQYNQYYKYSETVSGVKTYVVEHSKVTVPEDYLKLRLKEYEEEFKKNYVTDGGDLETYLKDTYDKSYDETYKEWESFMTETIKAELVFEKIADNENVEIDEDEFKEYLEGLKSNYRYADDEALYKGFGNGNAKEGEAYVRRLYRINTAIDKVVETAVVSVAEPAAAGSGESTQSVPDTQK